MEKTKKMWQMVPTDKVTHKIETLDVQRNQISCIPENLFAGCDWSSLKKLYLGQNILGSLSENICDTSNNILGFLKHVPNIEVLDLSDNKFKYVPSFTNNHQIIALNMSNNQLRNWTTDIRQFVSLKVLDLSGNKIQYLDSVTTNGLDELNEKNNSTPVVLDLRRNVLRCDCQTLHFIKWINSTR